MSGDNGTDPTSELPEEGRWTTRTGKMENKQALPKGEVIFQHQYRVTFNQEPVNGLTDWVLEVTLDYIACEVALTFHSAYFKGDLSHHKLSSLLEDKKTTLEVITIDSRGNDLITERFHNLELKALSTSYSTRSYSSKRLKSEAAEEPVTGVTTTPLYVNAVIGYGNPRKENDNG